MRIYINSYGGSGSTFLCNKLAKIFPEIHFTHIHSGIKPENYILKNNKCKYTGHNEGLLEGTKNKNNDKVIFILRNFNDAYNSRVCLKHVLHLNDYDENYCNNLLNNEGKFYHKKKIWNQKEKIF